MAPLLKATAVFIAMLLLYLQLLLLPVNTAAVPITAIAAGQLLLCLQKDSSSHWLTVDSADSFLTGTCLLLSIAVLAQLPCLLAVSINAHCAGALSSHCCFYYCHWGQMIVASAAFLNKSKFFVDCSHHLLHWCNARATTGSTTIITTSHWLLSIKIRYWSFLP